MAIESMAIGNMDIYNAFCNTPKNAQKAIQAGRLKGFTDINPMYRIKALTEKFGPCGIGWLYEVTHRETIEGANGEVKVFVQIALRYVDPVTGEWSAPVYGDGGSSLVSAERNGLYTDDECYKKAITDAIGSACKLLGMSADIYWAEDRTKYTATGGADKAASKAPAQAKAAPQPQPQQAKAAPEPQPRQGAGFAATVDNDAKKRLHELCKQYAATTGTTVKAACAALAAETGLPMNDETTGTYITIITERLKVAV